MALQNSSVWSMHTFLSSNTYYIPDYQREYSWEAEELGDFWDDLVTTKTDPDHLIHFFGQIVIHSDEADNKKYIIDGQQRTITSVIFLRALQLCYKYLYTEAKTEEANDQYSDIRSKYIGRYSEKSNSLHLFLSALDCDYFRKSIQLGEPNRAGKEKKKSHERLRKAYVYFSDKLAEALEEYGSNEEEKLECLNEYLSAFTERFHVLYLEATKLDEAFVIFETLNARGRDLETADLLKNYIFSQSKDAAKALNQWNSMIGALDKADPTKFIRHYWNSCHEFTREKALYRIISKEVSTPKASKELLDKLADLAPYYQSMSFPEDDSSFENVKLIACLKALRILKAKSFYPVILALKQADTPYSEDDIVDVAQTIESYVFRNLTICGKVANETERFFANLAKQIYDGVLDNASDICSIIRSKIVTDEEFINAMSVWTPSKTAKELIRYVLTKIHSYLDKGMELSLDTSVVHIEHIMPENSSKWDVPADIHEAYLWRFGNLMLLSGPLNIKASNRPFDEKKAEYLESKIEPNKTVAAYTQWGKEEIEDRQNKLCEYARVIWRK